MDRGKRSETLELLTMFVLAVLLRLFAGRNALTENGVTLFGHDEYYHMRRIIFTVENFPHTLWFDSYLDYPFGLDITWPPLYDQMAAALSLALGQHTQQGIEMVSAFLPVLLGSLVVILVYYLVREAFDRNVAILAAFMTAISPFHIPKTMIGVTDHHALEVLLMVGSILFLVLALSRKEKKYLFAAATGIMMVAMAYTWYGAIIYLLFFPIFAAFQITIDLKKGEPSREISSILLVALGIALLLMLPFWNAVWLWPSFLGIGLALSGIALMYAFSALISQKKISWMAFPATFLALAIAFILIAPYAGLESIVYAGSNYIFGGELSGKIGEAESLFSSSQSVFYMSLTSSLGWKLIMNLVLSLAGFAAFILYLRNEDENRRSSRLVIFIWAAGTFLLTIGQIRFLYLSTIATGILISLLFFWILAEIERRSANTGKKVPRMLAPALLFILVLPSLAQMVSLSDGVPPLKGDWQESLIWLKENSNTTGFFDYPSEVPEYSIMSLWDYGNWIVYESERPVVANNFQAGLEDSIAFFLSESEEAATAILNERNSKYVITEQTMLYGRLPSIASWANEDIDTYLRIEDYGSNVAAIPLPRLLNTTMARLYFFDGSGMSHFRLIYESSTLMGANPPQSMVKIFEYVPGAVIKVKADPDLRVGALLNMTSNQGRYFAYVNEGLPGDGYHEIRIPYSTEARYETYALGPYLVFAGNERGVKMQSLNVSERDILDSRTIEVSL